MKLSKKLISAISLVLCFSFLFSSSAVAQQEQRIDKSENASYTESINTNFDIGTLHSGDHIQINSVGDKAKITTPFFIAIVREEAGFFGKFKTVLFVGSDVKIISYSGNFCLVEIENGTTGYVFKFWLKTKKEDGLRLNRTYEHVYEGSTNINSNTGRPRTQASHDGEGTVSYSTDNTDIISVDKETGLITGKKPGTANLIAKVGLEEISIPVYCIYNWKRGWTGTANKKTVIYSGTSSSTKALATINSGTKFNVKGDDGGSAGWAYGYATVDEKQKWGFVKINDISTKGTVSQYNSMTTTITENGKEKKIPVVWPMYDETIKNISSPYAPRNVTSSGTIHHRGYDITTGKPGEIEGKYVVASFSGTVTKIHKNTSDCGYCISISTDGIDPVTKKNISIIYMHLKEIPKYKNGINISLGDYITVGTIIGKVGNTNGNTDPDMGYHLHFEANSQNAAVGDSGRSDFTYTLNPMYFFVEKKVTFSTTNSYQKYGGYWYNY